MTDIGTSQARGLAADDVLFMQQITGDTGSGLQGYAPDAFLHFPGISRVRRSQRGRGVRCRLFFDTRYFCSGTYAH